MRPATIRLPILSTCLVLGVARLVAAEPGYDVKREIAWARRTWASDLKGVRFGTPTEKLLAWVPAGGSIEAWAFSPSHNCDRVELQRSSGELVGESIVDKGVRQGREFRAWKVFSFGDLFSEGAEALRLEVRDADGTWQPDGQTGTIGRENATYGALSYVDATVARFGGTPLALYAECARPNDCKKISVTPVEANAFYESPGLDRGYRRRPNPAVARLDELQSHTTIWQPSGDPLDETPSLHRTLGHCLRTHYPKGAPRSAGVRTKP